MNNWKGNRTKPYTQVGIKRLSCIRCGCKALFQWQICSDGNLFRPICIDCDITLNELVLDFMGHPDKDRLIKEYSELKREGV